ncbi:MAG TPA: ABC transporter permease [Lysobacter sp.]
MIPVLEVSVERARFKLDLLFGLVKRDVLGRYRGSLFGVAWSIVSPLLMLVVYTVAFHELLGARWPGASGRAGFAVMVFVGLMLHAMLAEVLVKSPAAITGQPNFVKKLVFPLSVLPLVSLGSAVVHSTLGLAILLLSPLFGGPSLHATALLLPVLLLPFIVLLAGVSWLLAALGVYIRDIAQLGGLVATVLLFLSPIFFPITVIPERYRPIVQLNPLTFIVEGARGLLFDGTVPSVATYVVYWVTATVIAGLGLAAFKRLRPGFGDVL